jgi:hypothetical protein
MLMLCLILQSVEAGKGTHRPNTIAILWVMTSRSLVGSCNCFGGTYRLHLQSKTGKIGQMSCHLLAQVFYLKFRLHGKIRGIQSRSGHSEN